MDDSALPIPTTFWLALFPLTYLAHMAEEYWGGEGYPAYLKRIRGIELTNERFIKLELFGFVLIVLGLSVAAWLGFPEFAIAIFGALLAANGISHTVTAVIDRRYGPGLVTSALLWLPLGFFSLVTMFFRFSLGRFVIAALIGVGVQGGVALITLFSGRRTGRQ